MDFCISASEYDAFNKGKGKAVWFELRTELTCGVSGKSFSGFVLWCPARKLGGPFVCEKAAHENVSLTSVPGCARALENMMATCVHES